MTAALGRWRATYTPGEWVVLSGPSSLVLLEPPTHEWASLVNTLWDEVVASSSITDLAARLAHFKIDELPSLAAFFWTEDGMRSLIRGEISVVDLATGKVVANGEGIQTWSEVGLAGVDHIRVDLPHEGDATLLELPLVVGAVRASSVTLDASQQAQVSSPQADPELAADMPEADAASAAPVERTAPLSTAEIAAIANAETELMPAPFEESESGGRLDADAPQDLEAAVVPQLARDPAVVAAQAAEPSSDDSSTDLSLGDSAILAVLCPNGHASPPSATSCRVCGGPVAAQGPQFVAYPILAVLRASDGTSAELDRPILIGRAPSTDRSNSRAPRLMTVPSPNHDISRAHLEVAPDGWQIVVTDLNSTNGTILVRPGGADRQQLAPGEPVPVQVGSVIELGDGVSVLIDFPQ
ncbi:MAG TPA: FHA domain-containing protein [Propionibacteriaceae bacterium]|nr:FHA domain-containing protein [Propionibacteriaceae bacterium]